MSTIATMPETVTVRPVATVWEVVGYGQVYVQHKPGDGGKLYYFKVYPADYRQARCFNGLSDGEYYDSDDAASTAGAVHLVKLLTQEDYR